MFLFELAHLMLHACKIIRMGHRAKFRDKQMFRASFISGLRDFTRNLTSGVLHARFINRNLDSLS